MESVVVGKRLESKEGKGEGRRANVKVADVKRKQSRCDLTCTPGPVRERPNPLGRAGAGASLPL